jgi:NADH:ubiquinone oxidoreductase subunit E
MKTIHVTVCAGTACYVMGASEFLLLGELLPEGLRDSVEVSAVTCLDLCKNHKNGKPPFVKIDDEIMCEATVTSIIERLSQMAGE